MPCGKHIGCVEREAKFCKTPPLSRLGNLPSLVWFQQLERVLNDPGIEHAGHEQVGALLRIDAR